MKIKHTLPLICWNLLLGSERGVCLEKTNIFFLIILFTLSTTLLKAQDQQYNLVNNYSFEDTLHCPTAQEQINYAKGWIDPLIDVPGFTGSDYFNSCSGSMNVPHASGQGFQYAKTGTAYTGIWVYNYWSKEREYIETFIAETLKTNNIYFTEFFVSKSEPAIYAINKIGAYLSDTLVHKNTDFYNFNFISQISNPKNRFLTDTIGWIKISGIYNAHGGEKYITIGNFMPDSLTDTMSVPNIQYGRDAYYFIDDVSVYDITADAGRDTGACGAFLTDSIQIGSHGLSFCKYQWSPATGLSDPNIATPKAFPTFTTTYTLTISFADTVYNGTVIDTIYTSVTTDSVIIGVNMPPPIVDFNGLDTLYCLSDFAFPLTGTPTGGIFSGAGIIGNTFTPNIADTGIHEIKYKYADAFGCSDSSIKTTKVVNCDVVKEFDKISNNIYLYPNPAKNGVIFKCNFKKMQQGQIDLYNIFGQKIKSYKIDSKNNFKQISVAELQNGTYIYKIIIDDFTVKVAKLIIIK